MEEMECCLRCGNSVVHCESDELGPSIGLYGCLGCDTLYEEHQEHLPNRYPECWWKVSYMTFSEWRLNWQKKGTEGELSK